MRTLFIIKNFWVRLDNLLKVIVTAILFCLIFVLAHRAIFDPDIWLHLKTGEFIIQNKIIPHSDIFSFTIQGKPWVDHSWLFQTISYLIYNRWQAEGLIFLQSFIITLSFLVLLFMGYRAIKLYIEVAILILLTVYATQSRFNIRPEIFSLLFFALYLYLLRFHIDKRTIWLLVPIQVLWVNFHGYFFLGPLLVFLFIIAETLRRKIKFLPWQWKEEFALSDVTYIRLKRLLLFVVLACFLNPNAFKGAFYPLYVFKDTLLGKSQLFFKYIKELQPTFGKVKILGNSYYLIVVFCFSLMLFNFKKLKIIEILLVSFFFLFSLTRRHSAFFSFTAYTIIISHISQTLENISTNIKLQFPFRKTLYFIFRYGIVIILIAWLGLKVNNVLGLSYYDFGSQELKSFLSGIEHKHYPEKAVDFILENEIASNMLNDFNSGAYLIGRAYPKRKVFIDGRTEVYGQEFFKEYLNLMEGDVPTFERIIDRYHITAILLNMASRSMPDIITHIYKDAHWKLVFFDDTGVVFLKDIPSNQGLIDRYEVDFRKYSVPQVDLKVLGLRRIYPSPYTQRASLFNLLEEDEMVVLECKEALRIMPNCAEAYHLIGKVYLRKKLYQEAFHNLRSAAVLLPGNVEILVDLGNCLKELKETKAAIKTLKGALRLNRRYAPAYYQLGSVYLATNDETGAIQVLNKAIKYAHRKNPSYYFKLGEALYEKGKKFKDNSFFVKAKENLKKALELASQDKKLHREIEERLKEMEDKR